MSINHMDPCPHCGEVPLDVVHGSAECPNCGSTFEAAVAVELCAECGDTPEDLGDGTMECPGCGSITDINV